MNEDRDVVYAPTLTDPPEEDANRSSTLAKLTELRESIASRKALGGIKAFEIVTEPGRVFVLVNSTLLQAIGPKIPLKPDQAQVLGRHLIRAARKARKISRRGS